MNYGKNKNVTGHPPNKPMVPTAPTSLIEYSPYPLRRHIGQPFSQEVYGYEQTDEDDSKESKSEKEAASVGNDEGLEEA